MVRNYKPDKSHLIKIAPKHNWSDYQKAIFRDIAKGEGHTLVVARAGSSKTTVLVEGAKYIPRGKKALFCAFGKSTQEELRGRLGAAVECFTLHALGFIAIKNRFGKGVELDNNKCFNLAESLVGKNYDLVESITNAVGFCKATLTDVPSKIEELVLHYDIDLCGVDMDQFIKYVIQTLRLCKEKTNVIDYNDMIYFPFVYKLNVGKYDMVFIDEAQDLNKCQIELALSAVKHDGRVICVLDPRQAIYAWRGADSEVYNNLKIRFNPKELILPICYRCPRKVVELAQKLVPDIIPFEKSKDGEIIKLDIAELIKTAKPGSYVLSRVNAPLIKYCMQFIKNGTPANILGRDIGAGLYYLIKKSGKKTIKDLLKWLVVWEAEEKERILIKYPKANVEFIADKAECIRMLCEDMTSLEEVRENINKMFQDNDESKIVLFSSIHRIKGKETDDVFVLEDTLKSSSEEELNIQYVAFTRAKSRLFLVRKPSKYSEYDDKPKI